MLTSVRVPVLSEHITDTEPKVSTVLSDLHKTFCFRIRFAVMVNPAVRAIGSPSGMNAIPTLTQLTMRFGTLIQSGWSLRKYVPLTRRR